jgi:hypothetical protein
MCPLFFYVFFKTFLHFLSLFMLFFIANTINISAKTPLHPPTVRVRENVSLVLVGGEILFIMGKLRQKEGWLPKAPLRAAWRTLQNPRRKA